jgi:flagellar biogenesis protein FliO
MSKSQKIQKKIRPTHSSCVSRFFLIAAAGLLIAANRGAAETLVAPKVTGLPGALPDAGASVFRVFGALVLVIAIFLAGVWLFRNWQRFATRKTGGARLNLIEAKTLGQRQTLYVVGYQQQRMLLASSPSGVTLVSHLPDAEETAAAPVPAPAPAATMSFAEAFQQVLSRKS